jgi:hypothetical protein
MDVLRIKNYNPEEAGSRRQREGRCHDIALLYASRHPKAMDHGPKVSEKTDNLS